MNYKEHYHFYKGNRIPKLECFLGEAKNLFFASLPWGNPDAVQSFHEKISAYFGAAKDDNEATSPFSKFLQYPASLNNLHVAAQLENENVYKEKNREELQVGLECLLAYHENNSFGWVSCGGPSIILCKENQAPRIIHTSTNLSSDQNQSLSNLPKKMLGVHPKVDFAMDCISVEETDKILLFYSQKLNPLDMANFSNSKNLDQWVEKIHTQDKEHCFWIAELNFQG